MPEPPVIVNARLRFNDDEMHSPRYRSTAELEPVTPTYDIWGSRRQAEEPTLGGVLHRNGGSVSEADYSAGVGEPAGVAGPPLDAAPTPDFRASQLAE